MISRPTTEQILADAADQVRDTVLPAVAEPGVRVVVEMLEQVLRSCAVRSAHELAWIREEEATTLAYAAEVAAALPGSEAIEAALVAHRDGRSGGLHLDEAVTDYSLAGDALSAALEAALAAGDGALAARATELVSGRVDREAEIRGTFTMPGRG